ncbi:MAG: hemerythrin-like metal-binding protein [Gammaproteobacteria bacterium]|nr:MAG: hemerythrin-like metal-binding protein [Gammaproteobacteria bacterium]
MSKAGNLLQWKDAFSVGIPEVDQEHQALIALINDLYREMRGGGDVEGFLGELYAKIAAHFALEEKIMQALGYDRYREHKEDHERLLDELRDMMDSYGEGHQLDDEALAHSLDAWFTEHFKTEDARLHTYLMKRQ